LVRLLALPKNRTALLDVLNGQGFEALLSLAHSKEERVQLLVCRALGWLMELPRALLLKISSNVVPALTSMALAPAGPRVVVAAARIFFTFLVDPEATPAASGSGTAAAAATSGAVSQSLKTIMAISDTVSLLLTSPSPFPHIPVSRVC
jgi:hypothetical protein